MLPIRAAINSIARASTALGFIELLCVGPYQDKETILKLAQNTHGDAPSTSGRSLFSSQINPSWSRFHSTKAASIDQKEAAKFAALSSQWWDPSGPFSPLHRLNPSRCTFIRQAACQHFGLDPCHPEPLHGLRILDVGCGGGILSENIARMGGLSHGIDITEENVQVARQHATLDPVIQQRVR